MEFLNFGNGSDGALSVSGATTFNPGYFLGAGTSGTTTLTLGSSYTGSNGDFIWIHQLQSATLSGKEINVVVSGAGTTTLTVAYPLSTNYSSTGTQRCMVQRIPQYSNGSITAALSATAYNGSVGGSIVAAFSGTLTIGTSGSITATGKGFRGGAGGSGPSSYCYSGESGESYGAVGTVAVAGTGFDGSPSSPGAVNGSGGVGGQGKRATDSAAGGGGGSAVTAGTSGGPSVGGGNPAVSGGATGATTSTVLPGGGGGGGGKSKDPNGQGGGNGGNGGGVIYIFARNIVITGNGIFSNGTDGQNAISTTSGGGGAAGAGGWIKVWTVDGTFGTNKLLALGGAGGNGDGASGNGGNGGNGGISINACSSSGSTNPTATSTIGGFDFCSSASFIM